MTDYLQLKVSDEFKDTYFNFFYELSKEAFEMAKIQSGAGRFMTKKQCCEYLGISFGHLQKLEKRGLPIIDLEGKVLIDREDVIAFVNKYKVTNEWS